MPHMESVFFTDGKETGQVKFEGEVTEYLQDVKVSRLANIFPKVKNKVNSKKIEITIDFKQVGEK